MSFASVRQYAAENPYKLHWTAEGDFESSVQLTELEMVIIIDLLGKNPASTPAHAKLLEKLDEKVDQRVSDRRERYERQQQILSDTEVGEELAERIIADIHSEVRKRRLVFDRMEGKRYTPISFTVWAIPLGNFNNQNLLQFQTLQGTQIKLLIHRLTK